MSTKPEWAKYLLHIPPDGVDYIKITFERLVKRHMVTDTEEGYCSGYDVEDKHLRTKVIKYTRFLSLEHTHSIRDDSVLEWQEKSECEGSGYCCLWDDIRVIKKKYIAQRRIAHVTEKK